jgi:hypothetical protein
MKARPIIPRSESRKLKEKSSFVGTNYNYLFANLPVINNVYNQYIPITCYGDMNNVYNFYNGPILNEDPEYYNAAQGQMQYQVGVVEE